jgi:hypothetical protein
MNKIVFPGYWKISDVRNWRDHLFIFGDNDRRFGKKGQAIIRDEPNAAGIPTKKYPSYDASSFYTDSEYEQNVAKIDKAVAIIKYRLINEGYKGIILPEDGLGTGLANLPKCAPRTYAYLVQVIDNL